MYKPLCPDSCVVLNLCSIGFIINVHVKTYYSLVRYRMVVNHLYELVKGFVSLAIDESWLGTVDPLL